ncbi:hypothetical protein SAY86_005836 [Trapa natans]|uniref:Uncharacterized protein n=1 Tax=Trapa natans TaxID=22666 RepID=A0AAN7KVM6_TRANT|nr:hypothetical protein SAY86_005836 [Trapa natans]
MRFSLIPHQLPLLEGENYESTDENVDILGDEDDSHQEAKAEENHSRLEVHRRIDINLPNPDDEEDEIDANDHELNTGCNAAEALRAQVVGKKGTAAKVRVAVGAVEARAGTSL